MSWDHVLKSIKCPCGQGTIEKDTKMDDWNRYEESAPYINCTICKEKYRLMTITYHSLLPWKGDSTRHFLVDKNIELKLDYENKYPQVNDYQLAKSDFPHYIVVNYRLLDLLEAQKEINEKTSVSSLKSIANKVAKDRKRYIGSAKINDVRNDIDIALKDYDSFVVNKDKLDEQEELYKKAKKDFEDKISKNGIEIDI